MHIPGMTNAWTDERLTMLREMAATQEFSSTQIAAALGAGLTRCAVIGKARRLGIAMRPPKTAAAERKPRKPRTTMRLMPASFQGFKLKEAQPVQPEAVELPPDESPFACTILDLQHDSCRYPLGDPQSPDFRYCGCPWSQGSYCERHRKLTHYKERQYTNDFRLGRRYHSLKLLDKDSKEKMLAAAEARQFVEDAPPESPLSQAEPMGAG
jgi:GcrA cell cycle regulator